MKFGALAVTALGLLTLFAVREAGAAFDALDVDPRARAMGGAYTAADGGPFALYYNPASLVMVNQLQLAGSYMEPYQRAWLRYTAAGLTTRLPKNFGGIGFGFRHMGTTWGGQNLDSQNTFSIAHGVNLYSDMSSTVAVGWGLNLYNLEFGTSVGGIDPGSATTLGIDVGARVTLHNRTVIGFTAQNLNNPTIGNVDVEDLPRRVIGGVAYRPYAGVVTTFDMDSVLGEKVRFRGGTEFQVTDYGALRVGIATDPNVYSAGLGVHWHGVEFNYGFSSGAGLLDVTHQAGLTVTPGLLSSSGEE